VSTGGPVAEIHRPVYPVRLVTAASLFDGHDAAINVMRRILQSQGAEVIHLGHNRSVDEIVRAAVEEDAQGVAVSSYQGGHIEFFRYLVDRLRAEGRPDAKVYGGGGGVIVPDEIAELHDYGVTHVFSPEDGQRLGLARMVNTIVEACDIDLASQLPADTVDNVVDGDHRALARVVTAIQGGTLGRDKADPLFRAVAERQYVRGAREYTRPPINGEGSEGALFFFARLKADGGAGRDVETQAVSCGAIKL